MKNDLLQQIRGLWLRLSSRQRLLVGGGTILTVVAIAALVKGFASPDYKPLLTGLEPADAQAIGAELAAKKIEYQVSPDGRAINVAADQLDAARLQVASEGPSRSGRMGFELFDKASWGQTEFDEKVNYQRALEGELERTIATLTGVRSARVHLVLPTPSIFLDRERAAKASVALRMKGNGLSTDQLRTVARLVSGAVDGLGAGDVVIVDADTNETLGKGSGTLEGRELETELSRRLVATLGPAVGVDNLRASVNVEYELSSTEEQQDKYDPATSAVLSSQKTREQVGAGVTAGGVAGTAANLPANTPGATPQDASSAEDGSQLSTSENATFGVNKTVLHTVSPAGRIRRITAAVLVNDLQEPKQVKGKWVSTTRKPTTAEMDQIAQLARGVLGTDPARGDVVTVQNMSFGRSNSPDATLSIADKLRTGLNDYSTAVRYVALLLLFGLVWLLIFRPLQTQVIATLKELPAGGRLTSTSQLASEKGELALASTTVAGADSEIASAAIKRELADLIQAEPAAMSRTLQAWLREDNV